MLRSFGNRILVFCVFYYSETRIRKAEIVPKNAPVKYPRKPAGIRCLCEGGVINQGLVH